jgi:N-acetyl-1-D-myo-inositol-2-amino-2-deoxy-alpha-D-glucopyranoside deacetylase
MALTGKTILCVFAHPDDESLACGGTLARAADAGARVILFCASRGEAGSVSDTALVPDGDLGAARTRELSEAAGLLGIAEVIVMNHPDGELRWNDAADMERELGQALQRYRPDAVITFGEDGLYWHDDHVGIHEHTVAAVAALGAAAPPLYYVTLPPETMPAVVEAARARSGAASRPSLWGISADVFGYKAAPPTIVVDVSAWAPRKLAALRAHRTQVGLASPFTWIDDNDARRLLGVEHFHRAPLASTGGDVLETLRSSNP